MNLNFYYLNVRGLNSKLTDIYLNIIASNYNCLFLTETWLKPHLSSNLFIPNNFNTYRDDRTSKNGGGVLIAIDSSFNVKQLFLKQTIPSIDNIWLFTQLNNNKTLILGNIYIPPNTPYNDVSLLLSNIELLLLEHKPSSFILLGDFNIPNLNWNLNFDPDYPQPFYLPSNNNRKQHLLTDFCNLHNLSQHNSLHNSSNNILDLLLTNQPINSFSQCHPLSTIDKFHPCFSFSLKVSPRPPDFNPPPSFNYAKTDFESLTADINNINWDDLYNSLDINTSITIFNIKLSSSITKNIPLNKNKYRKFFPPWFSSKSRQLIKLKNKWHLKNKIHPSPVFHHIYSSLRSISKSSLKLDYSNYINQIENNVSKNRQDFWKYVKANRIPTTPTNTCEFFLNNTVTDNPHSSANLFADYFNSVFQANFSLSHQNPSPNLCPALISVTPSYEITLNDISSAFKKLKPSKTLGPDGIPAIILKTFSQSLYDPLIYIFNQIISTCTYPDIWKHSFIIPVHKKLNPNDVSNYRPISIICAASKIFEYILHKHLSLYFKDIIIEQQHGFCSNKSSLTHLLNFTDFAFTQISNKHQVDSIAVDFQKAFDSIDHQLLLSKLKLHDIPTDLLTLFTNYLSNRHCTVKLNNAFSNSFSPPCGLPQGTILSPLLFNIFINDVKQHLNHSNFLLYADDLLIFSKIENITDHILLQEEY